MSYLKIMKQEDIKYIVKEYKTPLYVFNEVEFVNNYRLLESAMRAEYPDYVLGYSYKTNYTPYVCKLVKSLGGYAEVVSDMEYSLARKIGYDNRNIIYNGPLKGPLMDEHLLSGGISNIDNEVEAHRVVQLAEKYTENIIKVGIRINTDIGAGFISRFGIQVNTPSFENILQLLSSCPNISIVGLHMHVSRARNISAWQNRIDNILEAADKYICGIPEYIDVGSGMFADMEDALRNQFSINVPSYKDYAKVVAGTMAKHYAKSEIKPKLISEPGTTIISRYFSLITSIKAIKEISGHNIAILDCDIHNAGETCKMMKLPFTHICCGKGKKLQPPIDLTGYTCLEQDVLYSDFDEPVMVGNIIEFRNVGGYSIVYKPPFIQPNCPIIAVNGSEVVEIKQKETFDDIFKTFKF